MRALPLIASLTLLAAFTACDDGGYTPVADSGDSGVDTEPLGNDDTDCGGGYLDADGDGYGDAALDECDDGWVPEGGDCDDADPEVSPGAPERCGDEIDDDCDGVADACAIDASESSQSADQTVTGESGGDALGAAAGEAGDLDGDDTPDLVAGARGHDSGAGAVYVWGAGYGPVESPWLLVGEPGDSAGAAISGGDFDGDGRADLLVGAPGYGGGLGVGSGGVYLLSGPLTGGIGLAEAPALIGGASGDALGAALTGAGDLNDDGVDDFVIGAPGAADHGDNSGAAYILHGPVTGGAIVDVAVGAIGATTDAALTGAAAAPIGDVSGDGLDDLLIAAPEHGANGVASGEVWLVLGPATGAITEGVVERRWQGGEGYQLGASIAGGVDLDGDGNGDLLLGAPGALEGAGKALVLLGPAPPDGDVSVDNIVDAWVEGNEAGDALGTSIAGSGVTPEDAAVAVGAPGANGGAGAAYLLYGLSTGSIDLSLPPPPHHGGPHFISGDPGDFMGFSIRALEANGDGWGDLLVGAPGATGSADNAGEAYLFYGGAP